MKKLAKIPSFLLSSELSASLKLQEQSYVILIPKSVLYKYGIESETPTFDLIFNNNEISLIGPSVPCSPRVTQPVEEIVDDIRS